MRKNFDFVVVGAGPTGCVAAAALARRGASVALLEANPKAANRFAGEWVHPPGVGVLERLGIYPRRGTAEHRPPRGFVVFPDDSTEPVLLPYAAKGIGMSCEHQELVDELRERVAAIPGVDYRPYMRVTQIEGTRLTVQGRDSRQPTELCGHRIVGAEGRSSLVRQSLGLGDNGSVISYMAGIDLLDVEMPYEDFGHVVLGGPGPILLYRISARQIRVGIDLPLAYSDLRRDTGRLWQLFSPLMPTEALRRAFRQALMERKVAWAASRFRPRAHYGRGAVALVGDAVGQFHQLTASGMNIGFLDGEALAQAADVAEYQRRRESATYVSELLAGALYQVVTREDDSAARMRRAVYQTWRESSFERERTMRILAGDEVQPLEFGQAFARVAGMAVQNLLGDAARHQLPAKAWNCLPWATWPLASVLPAPLRQASRCQSTAVDPLHGLRPRRSWLSGVLPAGVRGWAPEWKWTRGGAGADHVAIAETTAVASDSPSAELTCGEPTSAEKAVLLQSAADGWSASLAQALHSAKGKRPAAHRGVDAEPASSTAAGAVAEAAVAIAARIVTEVEDVGASTWAPSDPNDAVAVALAAPLGSQTAVVATAMQTLRQWIEFTDGPSSAAPRRMWWTVGRDLAGSELGGRSGLLADLTTALLLTDSKASEAVASKPSVGSRQSGNSAAHADPSNGRAPLLQAPLLQIEELEQALRRLLLSQTAGGGFATQWGSQDAAADIEATRRCVRALRYSLRVHPGLLAADLATALRRAAAGLRTSQDEDGGWRDEGRNAAEATALALLALQDCGVPYWDPAVRRGGRRLAESQGADGRWPQQQTETLRWFERLVGRRDQSAQALKRVQGAVVRDSSQGAVVSESAHGAVDATAVLALLRSRAPFVGAVARGLEALGGRASAVTLTPGAGPCWYADLVALVAVGEASRMQGERDQLTAGRRSDTPPAVTPSENVPSSYEADWEFCRRSLVQVSRTFARPIEMLPETLGVAVTCGYLLCRVADTVEDLPDLTTTQREALYGEFLRVLEDGAAPDDFMRLIGEIGATGSAITLAGRLDSVMRVYRKLPVAMQQSCTAWIAEMTRGMNLYSRRLPDAQGLIALHTESDLERYCYYVAGTVGHMLTELFIHELPELTSLQRSTLRQQAEAFGIGLQLVNILKDVTDDRQRHWSFIPRSVCDAQGFCVSKLLDNEVRRQAHRAVEPLFDRARELLDGALEYCLAIPPTQDGIRLFCLLPLWMAARTLVHGRGNDSMFVAGKPVKISRDEVESLIAECVTHGASDDELRECYAALWGAGKNLAQLGSRGRASAAAREAQSA